MHIGIGLANPVPGTPGPLLVDWARRAEERGFNALATIDRIAYPSHDSLTVLAVAAGATSRIGLVTNILLGPAYPPTLLAKATASLASLSGGRFTLGLAPGGRADDYAATGSDFSRRGRNFDAQLELLQRAWQGQPVGGDREVTPALEEGGVPVLTGGATAKSVERALRFGDGWTAGGAPPEAVAPMAEQVRAAWKDGGRTGEPRIAALAYYSVGADAEEGSLAYLRDYYGFLGEWAETIAQSALRTDKAIADAVDAYRQVGVTEFYLDPTFASIEQVDRLADVVLTSCGQNGGRGQWERVVPRCSVAEPPDRDAPPPTKDQVAATLVSHRPGQRLPVGCLRLLDEVGMEPAPGTHETVNGSGRRCPSSHGRDTAVNALSVTYLSGSAAVSDIRQGRTRVSQPCAGALSTVPERQVVLDTSPHPVRSFRSRREFHGSMGVADDHR
jgi:alkanesulfonate monooxygenase SsuD/methylene tetrahydromethanopterin reductase-like flavin-dependent oxidoreductase (luciferase family)